MKVKTLLIAAFAAFSLSAVAQVSDDHGTSARDGVYIKSCEAKVGEEITLNLVFDTQTPYAAAQADVIFPTEGLTAVKGTRTYFKKLSNARWDEEAPHSLADNQPTPGDLRYVLFELSNATFAAGNDAMLSVKFKVEKEGVWNCKINKIHWSTGIVGGVGDGDGPDSEFTITATSSGVTDINAAQTAKTYKVIENGQVYIIAGDKKYNVMGAEVK